MESTPKPIDFRKNPNTPLAAVPPPARIIKKTELKTPTLITENKPTSEKPKNQTREVDEDDFIFDDEDGKPLELTEEQKKERQENLIPYCNPTPEQAEKPQYAHKGIYKIIEAGLTVTESMKNGQVTEHVHNENTLGGSYNLPIYREYLFKNTTPIETDENLQSSDFTESLTLVPIEYGTTNNNENGYQVTTLHPYAFGMIAQNFKGNKEQLHQIIYRAKLPNGKELAAAVLLPKDAAYKMWKDLTERPDLVRLTMLRTIRDLTELKGESPFTAPDEKNKDRPILVRVLDNNVKKNIVTEGSLNSLNKP